MKKNFFIVYTAFQEIMVKNIIEQYFLESKYKNYILSNNYVKKNTPNVRYYGMNKKNLFLKFFFNLKWLFLLRFQTNADFFIPHTEGLLGNFIYNRFKKKSNISFYYEGTLYFIKDYKIEDTEYLKRVKMISRIFGFLGYKHCPYILPINSNFVKNVYSPFKNIALDDKTKLIRISIIKKELIPIHNNCLILGQNLPHISKETIHEIYDSIILDILKENKNAKIYFKDHPASEWRYKNNRITEMDKTIPIEISISDIKPLLIVSLASSALIHLKLFYNTEIKYISYAKNDFFQIKQIKQIFDVIAENNIEIKILN